MACLLYAEFAPPLHVRENGRIHGDFAQENLDFWSVVHALYRETSVRVILITQKQFDLLICHDRTSLESRDTLRLRESPRQVHSALMQVFD